MWGHPAIPPIVCDQRWNYHETKKACILETLIAQFLQTSVIHGNCEMFQVGHAAVRKHSYLVTSGQKPDEIPWMSEERHELLLIFQESEG